jgi:hypothetical protein
MSNRGSIGRAARAFPSWFPRIVWERCGNERMIAETHTPQGDPPIRGFLVAQRLPQPP